MGLVELKPFEVRDKFYCRFQRRWTDQDERTLKAEFPSCPLVELCLMPGRSPGGVMSRLNQLKLVWCHPQEFRFVVAGTDKHYITWRDLDKLKEKMQCSAKELRK